MRGDTLDLKLGRVVGEERERYSVVLDGEEVTAVLSGKFRHQANFRSDLPTVGDFVRVSYNPHESFARILSVEPRKSELKRKLAGEFAGEQLLGANVDTAFVLNSLNRDLNLRRIERYLVMIRDGGIEPVIVLTKADLISDRVKFLFVDEVKQVAQGAQGVKVVCTNINNPDSFHELKEFFKPNQTIALLGSSGVGKSTMTNFFLQSEAQKIQEIGSHAERGRHTTTSRKMFLTHEGSYLMDTPGIREIQLWNGEQGFDESFEDVKELLGQCRFTNCKHEGDLGCAIQEAIDCGELEAGRFKSYLKIQREQAYMQAKEKARTSNHLKHIWKNRQSEYRRGKKKKVKS